MDRHLIRHTRESVAREYRLAKCYAGNGRNWSVSGEWEALSGDGLMLSVLGVLDLAEKVGKR